MDDSNSNRQEFQKRFLIAIVLSVAILAGWTYFFPPPKPAPNNNSNTQANSAQTPAPAPAQAAVPAYQVPEAALSAPQKIVTVDSPLYTVKLDARGAVPISWIIKKHVSSEGEKNIYSIASTREELIPLELISPKGLESSPREVPLRVITGDANTDAAVNENAYQVKAEGDEIHLSGNESKTIEFTQSDAASGLEITKKFTFRADSPVSDLQIKITKGGQPVPNVRLGIGPSIGDQGIKKHYFYRAEADAVAAVANTIERRQPTTLVDKPAAIGGETDWAAVGDTYLAMAVVPAQPAPGVEFTGTKFEQEIPAGVREGQTLFQWLWSSNDLKETRHLTTAWLPITADGSTNKLFVGAKDHFAFGSVN